MSTVLPIVCVHCLPALAMRRKRLSPGVDVDVSLGDAAVVVGFPSSRSAVVAVTFAAARVARVGPEKNAWML
jgi:hypothetical protein